MPRFDLVGLGLSAKQRSTGLLLTVIVAAGSGCASLQQLVALRQVDFSLAGVVDPRLGGVDLSRIRSYSDLSASDVARLGVAIARKDLPFEFTLNVQGVNPRDNNVTARMIRMQWTLLLQNKETINGSIDQPVAFPPGEPVTIPMPMRLNLFEFFGGTTRDLVDLALAVAGANPEPVTISLRAVPTIDTPIGPISYPNPITIISRTL